MDLELLVLLHCRVAQHREPRAPGDATRRRRGERGLECAYERVEADPCLRGDLDDRRSGERRSGKGRHKLVAGKRGPRVVDEVAFRERDDTTLDAEQSDDREVLARLRTHALVRGHYEENRVDPA